VKDETKLSHLGRDHQAHYGAVNTPVYRASTIIYDTLDELRGRKHKPYTYGRRATPTSASLQDAIAELEGGAYTALCPSGVSAISLAFLSTLSAGDHVLIVDTAYEPTRHLADGLLNKMNIEVSYYDPRTSAESFTQLVRETTRLCFAESPGSLTFEVQDIPALAQQCHQHDILLAVDNTWASPYFCKPLALGADISIQSATKYIVGHADALLGTVTTHKKLASTVKNTHGLLGLTAGPDDCYLALRGMRSLSARLKQHEISALAMADWLTRFPFVRDVLYPARPNHPDHALWQRDFSGATGLFSVILDPISEEALANMLDHLQLFAMGYSWGGYESLVLPVEPHRTASPWQKEGQILRLHIGLENIDDLKADLLAGFERAGYLKP